MAREGLDFEEGVALIWMIWVILILVEILNWTGSGRRFSIRTRI